MDIVVPARGERIIVNDDLSLSVPDNPIIPFIEGDGIGADITPVMRKVVDAAVARAFHGRRQIHWMELFSGEKAANLFGGEWYPAETLDAIKEYSVIIKGPLAAPIGEGFRSLNVALRQEFDLYVCLRPVRWVTGTPAPVREPGLIDIVVFRENSEDIYAGIEWKAGTALAEKLTRFLLDEMGVKKIRFPDRCSIGIKPISEEGSRRLIRRAIRYAIDHDRPVVTLVHKGDVLKATEGLFRQTGYALARQEFGAEPADETGTLAFANPRTGRRIVINDVVADTMLQKALTQPQNFSVIATPNQNGDYLSDVLAAQIGSVGTAPSANIGDTVALFEATHGTAPRYAGLDKVNPAPLILAAEMLLRHIGWLAAADCIVTGLHGAVSAGTVTYDLASRIPGSRLLGCSAFGDAVIRHMSPSGS